MVIRINWMLLIAGFCSLAIHPASAQENYQLSKLEAEFVKSIAQRDQMIRDMSAAARGLSAINDLLGRTITGPVAIAITWNDVAISGFRLANQRLAELNKSIVCLEIASYSDMDGPNRRFFDQLSKARGCDEK